MNHRPLPKGQPARTLSVFPFSLVLCLPRPPAGNTVVTGHVCDSPHNLILIAPSTQNPFYSLLTAATMGINRSLFRTEPDLLQ